MKTLVPTICLMLILSPLLISNYVVASDRTISKGEIIASIDKMLFSNEYNYEILNVSVIIKDMCVVSISPPYREFPNVLVFKNKNNHWHRVFEGLCVGIQSEPSSKLDLHTIDLGADVLFDGKPLIFDDPKTRKAIAEMASGGAVVIPYETFTHIHTSIGSEEFYTIDKSKFNKYAIQLLGNKYYPQDIRKCTMFDMPEIVDIEFKYIDERYILRGITNNNQIWTISFDGVDSDNMFLINKKITVKIR
ncbi:MAG: hypothetical protein JW837_04955 [Sedimentisphaerales bacterium]|nr:hypothetical protein [Sedimentisphaerales bacterium]